MKWHSIPILLSLAAGALVAGSDHPRFAPEEDSSATKKFTEETRWRLLAMEQSLDGMEVMNQAPDMSGEVFRSVEVFDRWVTVADGRPTELVRSFESVLAGARLEFAAPGMEESYEVELESALDGRRVRFLWDAEERRHLVEAHDDEALDPLGLAEDADLRALLPPSDVELGDSWELDAEALADVLRPCGDLRLLPVGIPPGEYGMLTEEDVLSAGMSRVSAATDEVSGEATATWVDTTDGRASIALELDLLLSAELGERLPEAFAHAGHRSLREDLELGMDWAVAGTGELVWDVEEGRFVRLELTLESEVDVFMSWTQERGDSISEFDMLVELEAETRLEGTCEE